MLCLLPKTFIAYTITVKEHWKESRQYHQCKYCVLKGERGWGNTLVLAQDINVLPPNHQEGWYKCQKALGWQQAEITVVATTLNSASLIIQGQLPSKKTGKRINLPHVHRLYRVLRDHFFPSFPVILTKASIISIPIRRKKQKSKYTIIVDYTG